MLMSDVHPCVHRMGISIRKPTVVVDGFEKMIDVVLIKGGTRTLVSISWHRHVVVAPMCLLQRTWQWRFSSVQTDHLSWTFDSPIKYVSSSYMAAASLP